MYMAMSMQLLVHTHCCLYWVPETPAHGSHQALCTDGLNLAALGGHSGAFLPGGQHMAWWAVEQVSPQ